MSDKYIWRGGSVEASLVEAFVRLKELGAKGTPFLYMREKIFRALVGTIRMDTEPPCLIIQGEPIAVVFDESIPEERMETEGATGYTSDIVIRFFLEGASDE